MTQTNLIYVGKIHSISKAVTETSQVLF